MTNKYRLGRAFHPKAFEKGIYAVSFYQPGKPRIDRYTKFTQVRAGSRDDAIRKARKKLRMG